MCVSRDTRRIDFLRVDELSMNTPVLGRHIFYVLFVRGSSDGKHPDEPITRRSIPPLASGHGEKARGTSKTYERVAGLGRALTA